MTTVGLSYLFCNRPSLRRNTVAADRLRLRALYTTSAAVFEFSGYLMHTQTELEHSAFYPFKEAYTHACSGGTLSIRSSASPSIRYTRWLGKATDAQGNVITSITVTTHVEATPANITLLRAQAYTSGIHNYVQEVYRIRSQFMLIDKTIESSYGRCYSHLTPKPIPMPLVEHDYPTNSSELKQYLRWIEKINGADELLDGWERPLRFQITGNKFVCSSSGADGKFLTADDIKNAVLISNGILPK